MSSSNSEDKAFERIYDDESSYDELGSPAPVSSTWNRCVLISSILISLSSFSYGINISLLNIPESVFKDCTDPMGSDLLPRCIAVSKVEWSLVVSIFCLGGLFGALGASSPCERLGRKGTLLWNNAIFFFPGYMFMGFAWNPAMLVIGRVLTGMASGIATVAVPLYLGEISPTTLRGTIGTFHQLAIVLGLFASQFIAFAMSLGGQTSDLLDSWRYLFLIGIGPLLLQSLGIFWFTPESPKYLLSRGRKEMARNSLQMLRGKNSHIDAEFDQWCEIIVKVETETPENEIKSSLSFLQLLKLRDAWKSLAVGTMLHVVQQFSGINAVFYFSTGIFQSAGFDGSAVLITLIIGLVNIIATLISLWLMDRSGRRTLALGSTVGMFFCCIAITTSMILIDQVNSAETGGTLKAIQITAIFGYVLAFAVGLGPIPWIALCDIFPANALAVSGSYLVTVNWLCNFILLMSFDSLQSSLQSFVFIPFGFVLFLGSLGIYLWFPETKRRVPAFLQ